MISKQIVARKRFDSLGMFIVFLKDNGEYRAQWQSAPAPYTELDLDSCTVYWKPATWATEVIKKHRRKLRLDRLRKLQ